MSGKQPIAMADRFWPKIRLLPSGCWQWIAATVRGYGTFRIGSRSDGSYRNIKAHRFAYESLIGPIADGLQIDHLCRNKACVNPLHLETVTNRVNVLRGNTFAAFNAQKTYCPKGHPYNEANTGRYKGSRFCRICGNKRRQKARLAGKN